MSEQDTIFRGMCLCSTGLELDVKQQVRKIVVACGGRFDDDLDPETTTHLIAEAVGSLKHRVAVSHELPVASPRWVFESFRAQKLLNVRQFGLRLLEGMGICTTGLTLEQKEIVSQLVTTNGGQYDGRLESGFTDILIAQHRQGPKYEAAVATDIPVVHLGWLYACLERQILVDEDEFALRIEGSLHLPNIAKNQQNYAQEIVTHLPYIVKRARETEGCVNVHEDWVDVFDGCVIYLLGFSPRFNTLLQRLLRTGMGTIYHQMVTCHVTHVVVSASLSDKQTLEAIRTRVIAANVVNEVHFVSASWVIDCVKCLDLQPEELYPVEFDAIISETRLDAQSRPFGKESSVFTDETLAGFKDIANRESLAMSDQIRDPLDDSSTLETFDKSKHRKNLFSGYSFLLLCRDPDDEHMIKPMLQKIRECGNAEAFALLAMDFVHLDPKQFSFLSYVVVCTGVTMDEHEALKMQARIHDIQRQERTSRVDTVTQADKRPRLHMLQFVSDVWLACSLAAQTKLSFSSHELFEVSANRPRALFTCRVPLPGFQDVRASTSVYLDVEQLVVIQLLQIAGAQVTRKLSTRNTHLICRKAIGMKFTKATKWGLSVVNARWIVDCLLQGTRLSEDKPNFQVVK